MQAEHNAGLHLTEGFAMAPAASVSGFYFSHPQADYAARRGIDPEQAERWLAPNLAYEP